MKPVYLEFCGVNSFSERAEIDFKRLLDYGIFGIFGDTGSGKSTILDCIVFALYGKVSRLDAKEAVISNLINFGSDRAYVNFEFEIEYDKKRRLYRVERELKRKNSYQSVRVYECKGEGKERVMTALAEGPRDGNALLEQIIGLEQRDFEKCIALPQGEFAQFVKSQRSDRLKLVSRLFDLERYGEGMVKKINRRNAEAQRETEVLKARLEPYGSVTEEGIAALKREIRTLEAEEKKTAGALTAAREKERELTLLAQKRKEYERAAREMERLEAVKAEMSKLNDELSRLEKAANALACYREARAAEERYTKAAQAFERAKAESARAEQADRAAKEWNAEQAAEEIEGLTAQIAAAQTAERDEAAAKDYREKLARLKKEYDDESQCFAGFDYEKDRAAQEKAIAALGGGNFFAYAEEHGKAGLLRAEYATFAGELVSLTEKHPQISADSDPLIEKYRKLSSGERTDFSRLKEEFEERERAREQLRAGLQELEKRKTRYDIHVQSLVRLKAESEEWQARLDAVLPRLKERALSAGELGAKLTAKRAEQKRKTAEREEAAKLLSAAQVAFTRAEAETNAARERLAEARARFGDALAAGGFRSGEEAASLAEKYGDSAQAREKVEKYKEDYAAAKRLLRELSGTDYSRATEEAVAAERAAVKGAEEAEKELAKSTALKREELARAESDILKKKELSAQYAEKRKEAELCDRLKKLLEGNKFMEFVAEEYLQTVAKNASARLLSLTDGRYFLRYDGGFVVGDNFNGGAPRGVFTLSGGETFLVSLSLALALSAEICLRSLRPIEFFFLDEGFGTLDEKLVDTVMDSLEKLKGEHFSIGIISHVEELRHRIGRKLTVKKATERHGSQITIE